MTIQIDKGVPMPEGAKKYPFSEMEVGDSFVWPSESWSMASNYCRKQGNRLQRKFCTRKMDGFIRIFRTA